MQQNELPECKIEHSEQLALFTGGAVNLELMEYLHVYMASCLHVYITWCYILHVDLPSLKGVLTSTARFLF
jgi:hypothetical protein